MVARPFNLPAYVVIGEALAYLPTQGGTLQIGVDASPLGLEPHLTTAFASFIITGQIDEGLAEIDESLRPRQGLVEFCTASQDGLNHTFRIRPGVTFHDGEKLTAGDIVF